MSKKDWQKLKFLEAKIALKELISPTRCQHCVHGDTKGCADGFIWCDFYNAGRNIGDFCQAGTPKLEDDLLEY